MTVLIFSDSPSYLDNILPTSLLYLKIFRGLHLIAMSNILI